MTVYSCGNNGYGESWIQNDLGYGWRPAPSPPAAALHALPACSSVCLPDLSCLP